MEQRFYDDSNNYGWVQKIAMRNVSRNNTATYLLYLLVQEFCGEYFCTTMNIITSRSLSSETFSRTEDEKYFGPRTEDEKHFCLRTEAEKNFCPRK